jgi:NAD(P)-dependent dehydrogenase (short-subunit alcohol dehydrogenase family)
VIIAGRKRAPLDQVATETGAQAIVADVTDEASVAALFAAIDAGRRRARHLVNNAGIPGPWQRAADIDIAAFDETIAINVRGTLLCIKLRRAADARARRRIDHQHVVADGACGRSRMRSAYTASKYAVLGITDPWRRKSASTTSASTRCVRARSTAS